MKIYRLTGLLILLCVMALPLFGAIAFAQDLPTETVDPLPECDPDVVEFSFMVDGQFYLQTLGEDTARELIPRNDPELTHVWTPSGNQLLFRAVIDGVEQLHMYEGDTITQITDWEESFQLGISSPTVTHVAFVLLEGETNADVQAQFYILDLETGRFEMLLDTDANMFPLYAFSPDSSQVLYRTNAELASELVILDVNTGETETITSNDMAEFAYIWSPDGQRIAFSGVNNETIGIYTMNADGSDIEQVTFNNAVERVEAWSNDGSRILFTSAGILGNEGNEDLYLLDLETGSQFKLSTNPALEIGAYWWSEDNRWIVYSVADENGRGWLFAIDAMTGKQRALYDGTWDTSQPVNWSRDNEWILYVSNKDGQPDIYATNLANGDELRLTDTPELEAFARFRPCAG